MSDADAPGRRDWFKSSFSKDANSCVEVRFTNTRTVEVRDSKYTGPTAEWPTIAISPHAWPTFLALTLDVRAHCQPCDGLTFAQDPGTGDVILRDVLGTELVYSLREWDAFTAGIKKGEFSLPLSMTVEEEV